MKLASEILGRKAEIQEKIPRSKGNNQQQTQPTYESFVTHVYGCSYIPCNTMVLPWGIKIIENNYENYT